MKVATSQNFLIMLNESLIYYFFLDNNRSLHYNIYTNKNILLKSEKLASSIIEFSATTDKEQEIHLICITSKGELQYYINKNDNWSYKTISKFDIRSNKYKYLFLHTNNSYTHILYTKTNILTQALSTIEHIYWDNKNTKRVVVSNFVHGKYNSPLQVSLDSLKNIHLMYKVFYKNNHQLYYSKFNISTKVWTASELITDLKADNSHPYIFIDKKQNLHLVWCTIEQNNFILKYKKKNNIINIKSRWSNTQTLSSKNSNYLSPILFQELNTLKIYCKQNDKIIEIISKDFGDSWTNSINDKPYIIEEPKIIQYSSNLQIDDRYLAKHVYGNIKDTVQIIGINLFNNKEQNQLLPIEPTLDQEQDSLINIDNRVDTKIPLTTENIINLIKNMDNKINTILSQIIEYESKNHLMDTPTQKNNYTLYEIKQNNNEIIDLDRSDNTSNKIEESNNIINELLFDYNALEKQLLEIEEKKQKLTKSINDYEVDLNLLEEKIVDYKKQILTFQEKLNDITSNNNIFKRFINFFK